MTVIKDLIKNTSPAANVDKPVDPDKAATSRPAVQQVREVEIKDQVDVSGKKASQKAELNSYSKPVVQAPLLSDKLTGFMAELKGFLNAEDSEKSRGSALENIAAAKKSIELSAKGTKVHDVVMKSLDKLEDNIKAGKSMLDSVNEYLDSSLQYIRSEMTLAVDCSKLSSVKDFNVEKVNDDLYSLTYKASSAEDIKKEYSGVLKPNEEVKFSLAKGDNGVRFDLDPKENTTPGKMYKIAGLINAINKLDAAGAISII